MLCFSFEVRVLHHIVHFLLWDALVYIVQITLCSIKKNPQSTVGAMALRAQAPCLLHFVAFFIQPHQDRQEKSVGRQWKNLNSTVFHKGRLWKSSRAGQHTAQTEIVYPAYVLQTTAKGRLVFEGNTPELWFKPQNQSDAPTPPSGNAR